MSATAMIYFDTLQYVKTLKASGFSQTQSEALAEAQQEALSGCLNTTFATKADITDVRAEIADVRIEISNVKNELSEEIHEVKAEIKVLTSRVNRLDWMLGLLLTGMASLVVKAFFG